MDPLLKQWNETYFDGQLSPEVLNILDGLALSTQGETVQDVFERQFKAMKQTYCQATDFTDSYARSIGFLSKMVPDAWIGTPPPFTHSGRHIKLDAYIHCNPWAQFPPNSRFLDLGCGFPPRTTLDTAEKFPDWQIIGADPAIPYYIAYDEQGDYATFDQTGELLYFQGSNPQRLHALTQDAEGTKRYFAQLFQVLLADQKESVSTAMRSAGSTGARLVTNPVESYERTNLSFQLAGIGELALQGLNIIRCFNVLYYFDGTFRQTALTWFAEILREGGLLLCGGNGMHSRACRYTVYQKDREALLAREFACSIDNLRPQFIVSWYALHNDAYEMNMQLAVIEVIRTDPAFRRDFDSRLDALLAQNKLYTRDANGYLTSSWQSAPPPDFFERLAPIYEQLDQEGYVEGAVAVLKQAGYTAWRNCVGHISVDPNQFEV